MEVVDCEKTAFDRARRFMRGEAAGPRLLYLRIAFGLPDIKHILLFYALVDYHGVWYALSRIGLRLGFISSILYFVVPWSRVYYRKVGKRNASK